MGLNADLESSGLSETWFYYYLSFIFIQKHLLTSWPDDAPNLWTKFSTFRNVSVVLINSRELQHYDFEKEREKKKENIMSDPSCKAPN